jgi:autotransporter-associated beta strand protein
LSASNALTISVFSGSGHWTGAAPAGTGATSWGQNSNWADANASGVAAAPGTFAGYADTAILGNTGAAHATITLDGASPTLSSLTFNTASGGYTLQQGTGGTLTMTGGSTTAIDVAGGTHALSAPVLLSGGNLEVSASGSSQLTISGNIADDGGSRTLILDGDGTGTLVLSGTNSFMGGATVSSGTLILSNNEALADGSSLTVGDALLFGAIMPANGAAGAATTSPLAASQAIAPVPEPSSVALLLTVAVACSVMRRYTNRHRNRA